MSLYSLSMHARIFTKALGLRLFRVSSLCACVTASTNNQIDHKVGTYIINFHHFRAVRIIACTLNDVGEDQWIAKM